MNGRYGHDGNIVRLPVVDIDQRPGQVQVIETPSAVVAAESGGRQRYRFVIVAVFDAVTVHENILVRPVPVRSLTGKFVELVQHYHARTVFEGGFERFEVCPSVPAAPCFGRLPAVFGETGRIDRRAFGHVPFIGHGRFQRTVHPAPIPQLIVSGQLVLRRHPADRKARAVYRRISSAQVVDLFGRPSERLLEKRNAEGRFGLALLDAHGSRIQNDGQRFSVVFVPQSFETGIAHHVLVDPVQLFVQRFHRRRGAVAQARHDDRLRNGKTLVAHVGHHFERQFGVVHDGVHSVAAFVPVLAIPDMVRPVEQHGVGARIHQPQQVLTDHVGIGKVVKADQRNGLSRRPHAARSEPRLPLRYECGRMFRSLRNVAAADVDVDFIGMQSGVRHRPAGQVGPVIFQPAPQRRVARYGHHLDFGRADVWQRQQQQRPAVAVRKFVRSPPASVDVWHQNHFPDGIALRRRVARFDLHGASHVDLLNIGRDLQSFALRAGRQPQDGAERQN